jgi:K(+)-stimulated pyrophosphate-energized sodium pump
MGAEALGAYMAGVTVSGVLWAIFQNNAGGAWDNAKKSFEKGVEIDGQMYYKKSEPHKAAVVGDTVGDPFKDTSGPSMNILIKLTCLVGLTLAPLLGDHANAGTGDCHGSKPCCHMESGDHNASCDHKESCGHKECCKGSGKESCSHKECCKGSGKESCDHHKDGCCKESCKKECCGDKDASATGHGATADSSVVSPTTPDGISK